ncbi:MAG: 30S ribosome-binding factor RbfA [Azospira oryzae]|uniref:Ribosome-binding factor A n=1 Tax=Pelomicrobium methylotrophicum TaxID=2602750 RepID=A0A5C7EIC7_9PROT|nr:30S ribosome-binding factor RbfA [Pelomicrobium methylotrophicum]PZP64037.1 MAG: 30S ribosome-binding factor RbfA [Azospira oryzae]PZP82336.1 MAG: 30S ribosome-binding factor RbfA [Azospira oryzae]TXF11123.1 30S ribosome-binding factor RbfA [Pelomicrobium methylotrophicum]
MKAKARAQRVAREIQRELAVLIRDELKDPRIGMVTLTGVELSADLSYARVYYSSLRGRDDKETTEGLRNATPFLRGLLGQRLRLRTVPELRFIFDESVEGGMRLSRLIDEAVASDRSRDPDGADRDQE